MLNKADIISIYKDGSTELQDKHRPIFPLHIIYEIFAQILDNRVEEGVDLELQQT